MSDQPHEAGRPLERVKPEQGALFPIRAEGRSGIVLDDEGEPCAMVRLILTCAHRWDDDVAQAVVELWLPAGFAAEVREILARQVDAGVAEAAEYRARGN